MRKFLRYVFVILIFFLALCHISEADETEKRGILRLSQEIAWGGKETLDPASKYRFLEANLLLYETLVTQDERDHPLPKLAVSWESDETASVWTFRLRQGVTFHDGRPFTAKDVRRRVSTGRVNPKPSTYFQTICASLKRFDRINNEFTYSYTRDEVIHE